MSGVHIRASLITRASVTAIVTASLLLNISPIDAAEKATPAVKAFVWDYLDPWTNRSGATQLLTEAGFEVHPLPKDSSPRRLSGLVFIGSFASEDPAYQPYMKKYADDLHEFVDDGNVLVQMTQADQTENRPPFLPAPLKARRCDVDSAKLHVLSEDHTLAEGFATPDGAAELTAPRLGWETFDRHGGFEVVISSDAYASHPILMEGAYGQGRIVLAAMHVDKRVDAKGLPAAEKHLDRLGQQFAKNLLQHVQDIQARRAAPIQVTPAPRVQGSFTEGSWTLAILPDTQVYSLRYPGLFSVQTAWLRAHAKQRNIQYVLHLGDITNNNTPKEWERAAESMELLDGHIPYAIVGGNHDYGPSGNASTRDTLLNEYFPYDKTAAMPGFGGAFEAGKLDNTYHLFEAGGQKWIVLALEWGPRDATIAWANDVMTKHPDHKGILVTHAYLFSNSRRYDTTDKSSPNQWNPHNYRTPNGVNDGQELWDKLVRKHNFVFTFNGHVLNDGTGYRADPNDDGQLVHQMLANYQMRELGGEAYLRLLEFDPDGNTVHVLAYSPLYDRYMLEHDQSFTIRLDKVPAEQPDMKASAPSQPKDQSGSAVFVPAN